MRSDFKEVPLIDISGLYSARLEDRQRVADEISHAARNIGFFYVSGHRVAPETMDGLKEAAKQFFAQPMDYKMKYYIGKSNSHRGYVPEGEEVFDNSADPDHKEAIDLGRDLPLDHPLVKRGLPMHGPNQWPEELPLFKERVETYYDEVVALVKTLLHGFALALGMDETEFDQYFTDQISLFRLVKYPYDEHSATRRGIGEHTDYECFTVLLADSPGLEVVNRNKEWVAVPPIPGAFVVNLGDMMETLTNGAFVATQHRVLAVSQERYSFPMFNSCSYDVRVAPLPQFVNGKESRSAVLAGDHIWASLMQTYRYLIDRVKSGEMQLPENAVHKGPAEA